MERLILKSKDEPVEIHVLAGHDGAIHHAMQMLHREAEETEDSEATFLGVTVENLSEWALHIIQPENLDHTYKNGESMHLGDKVEISLSKGIIKKGVIAFAQSAYGIRMQEGEKSRFTPLCCFGEQVVFNKCI